MRQTGGRRQLGQGIRTRIDLMRKKEYSAMPGRSCSTLEETGTRDGKHDISLKTLTTIYTTGNKYPSIQKCGNESKERYKVDELWLESSGWVIKESEEDIWSGVNIMGQVGRL